MVIQAVLVETGIAALGKLADTLAGAVDTIDTLQKTSIALGMSLGDARQRLGTSMDGLRGTIETKLAGGFELLHEGFQGNMGGMAQLLNQQKLTDGNSQRTARILAELKGTAGLQNDALNELSKNTIKVANTYEVTTDKLVEAISKLDMETINVAGFGPDFYTAIQKLEGELGGQSNKVITSFINQLLDTSEEGFQRRAALGLADIDQRLAQATTTEDTFNILMEAINQASDSFESLQVEGLELRSQGVAMDLFGKAARDAAIIMERYAAEQRKMNTDIAKAGDNLGNMWAEFGNQLFAEPMFETFYGPNRAEVRNENTAPQARQVVDREREGALRAVVSQEDNKGLLQAMNAVAENTGQLVHINREGVDSKTSLKQVEYDPDK